MNRRYLPLILLVPLLFAGCRRAPDPASAPRIVFSRQSGAGVDLVQVSTARPQRVDVILPHTGDGWYPRAGVSHDGRYIAFVTDRPVHGPHGEWDFTDSFGNGSQLLLYDTREGELRHLDHGGYGADRPCFTPDGDAILFDRQNEAGNWDIYRLELESGELSPLAAGEAFEEAAAVSPDGAYIAYCSDESGALQIQLLVASTGQAHPVTSTGVNQDPAFSPDGRRIVYSSRRAGDTNLYLMPLTGDDRARRIAELDGDQRFPRFSPNGDFIAFTTYYDDGGSDIYLIDARGWGPPVRVTHTLSQEIFPNWLPGETTDED